ETSGGEAHLKAVAAVLAQFGKALRADIGHAAELGDADTADITCSAGDKNTHGGKVVSVTGALNAKMENRP
ncbi:MAG: hypothetical protein AAB289_10045, partial [Chloroflexota bacterium]